VLLLSTYYGTFDAMAKDAGERKRKEKAGPSVSLDDNFVDVG
jgi:hypothetical protein